MTPVQAIKCPKPLTKKIPRETIRAKYVSMEMFATIYDDYIKHKHCVKDILSIIHQNDDIIKETYTNNTLKRTPINILCIDETKLDNSFPMLHSK